jgi:hypothetical protein
MAFIRGVRGRVGDDPQPVGFAHLGERGREEGNAIVNQEPQRVDAVSHVDDKVAGLLHRPCSGRVRRHTT